MTFGETIKVARENAKITQREMADRIGIHYTYISKIENGKMEPPAEKTICRIADILGMDAAELILLAEKIPSWYAELIFQDKLVNTFFQKYKSLTESQKKEIKKILQE